MRRFVPAPTIRIGIAFAAALIAAAGACQGPDAYYRNADGGAAGKPGVAGKPGTAGTGAKAGTTGTTGAAGTSVSGAAGTSASGAAGAGAAGAAGAPAAGTGGIMATGAAGTSPPCTKCMVKIQYTCRADRMDKTQASFVLDVTNNASVGIQLSDLTLRYWYSNDATKEQVLDCDFAKLGCTNVSNSANQAPAPRPKFEAVLPPRMGIDPVTKQPVVVANTYVEIGFSAGALSLDPFLATGEIQLRLHNKDFTDIIQVDDYSFDDMMKGNPIDAPKITAYVKGVLVWGTEPVSVARPALVALAALGCVAPPAPAPDTAASAAPATTVPAAPAVVSAATDWAAPPTNGSPGVDVPKLTGHDLLKNVDFSSGKYVPWTTSFTAPGNGRAFVKDGQLCVEVTNKGKNPWDTQARHREMTIEKGHTYSIQFMAHATRPTKLKAKIGMAGPPYKEYWTDTLDLTTRPQTFVGTFAMSQADDPTAELAFHFGGDMAAEVEPPFSVCFDDIHLDDPKFIPARLAAAAPVPKVLVNQVGYLPKRPKLAVVKSASKDPLAWKLRGAGGAVLAQGRTIVVGKDAAAGEPIHLVDFSSVRAPGRGLVLAVGDDTSHPFAIADDLYGKLARDALAFFYQNRSGIPIAMPHAGNTRWERPAGHSGDKSVGCLPKAGCGYKLDVSGGWYDAGDHGKYVVNGGIAVWTMMNQYERAQQRGAAARFADGKLDIPENKNGFPDLLDEARWELDFLLRMQVPDGQPGAGLVHHKVHDKAWTALGLAPHEDTQPRYLWPPSTAATLNLAATAAQGARLWKKLDAAFAARCLAAAEKAWAAAEANPALYAPSGGEGGGPYDDRDVSDERYWAAAELFVTTKKDVYRDAALKSPHYKEVATSQGGDGVPTSMTWDHVAALGTISLALAPDALPAPERAACRAAVRAAADRYADIAAHQGYRLPFAPGTKGYPWGSSSFVLNNGVILALAHDFFGDARYLDAAAEGMSYLLGRNPLDQSYVTGWGARPLEHPHHRFWAQQANAKFPPPPPGIVSGGPNSGLQDPYAQAAGLAGCAPQTCFVDNIEAWSVNEVAINWNAPPAWLAAYLDER